MVWCGIVAWTFLLTFFVCAHCPQALKLLTLTTLAKPASYIASDYTDESSHLLLSSINDPIFGYRTWGLDAPAPANLGKKAGLVLANNAFFKAANIATALVGRAVGVGLRVR